MSSPSGAGSGRDDAWFAQLYRTQHATVLRYALRRVGADEADDVVAEVFTTVWRRRHEVPDVGIGWLLATARHHIQHANRSAARRSRLLTAVTAARETHGTSVAIDAELDRALGQLAPTDREILELSAWEELAPAEIAVVLGCPPGTVRVRLFRARRRLAAALSRPERPGSALIPGKEMP